MSPKISVIIPIYNVEAYLDRCLRSVLDNTYHNLEVLCVNDGSPDGCAAILDRFAAEDDRVQILNKSNGGISSARNMGLDAATGDYIVFVDSDDWVHPQYFELLLRAAIDGSYDLVLCDFSRPSEPEPFDFYDPAVLPVVPIDLWEVYRRRYAKDFVWGRLYRRSLIGALRFNEQIAAAEDTPFMCMVLAYAEQPKIAHIPLVLCYYFQRPGSLTAQISGTNLLQRSDAFLHCSEISTDPKIRALFLTESIKSILAARYMFWLQNARPDFKRCNSLLRSHLGRFLRTGEIGKMDKLCYTILCLCPTAYRLWRILHDPTLIAHEKNMRRARKQA